MTIRNIPEKQAMPIFQQTTRNEVSSTPLQSTVVSNESIKILKHKLRYRTGNSRIPAPSIEIAIRNISETTISNIVFEATFFDQNDNIVEIVKHNEIELKQNTSRAVVIMGTTQGLNRPERYHVRITKVIEANVEKVQLRQHQIRSTEAGKEEVTGIVKNISNSKTEAALVASFYDSKNEKIGTKVIIIKDIEPENYKQFSFNFFPTNGENIMTYNLIIVCDIEEC